MTINSVVELGADAGGVRVMRNRSSGQADILLQYIPIASFGVGTQIRGSRTFTRGPNGAVQEVPGNPPVVVVGPPSATGVWNLNTGGTLDLRNFAGQPPAAGTFVLVGEINQAEAEAILGGPLPP